jgi:hypothetical protein
LVEVAEEQEVLQIMLVVEEQVVFVMLHLHRFHRHQVFIQLLLVVEVTLVLLDLLI